MTFEQWRQDLYVACRGLLRVKAFTGTGFAHYPFRVAEIDA